MESELNIGHQHPMVLLNKLDQQSGNQSKEVNYHCARCGEEVTSLSTPSFGCAEESCGFYIHKMCAEAPSKINHPFHRDHPLLLLPNPPQDGHICNFCDKECKMLSVYRCDFCDLDFHIKCALRTYNIAQKNWEELQLLEPPSISYQDDDDDDEQHQHLSKCFVCMDPLAYSTYFSLGRGFSLHKICADLPVEFNYVRHRKYPLVLQFNKRWFRCYVCQGTQQMGLAYCCSPCKLAAHVGCVSPLPTIEDKSHPHPFILFQRRVSFICDACGIEGNFVAYICTACNIKVHKKCISMPRIIKSKWHDHNIFHKYFLEREEEDFKSWDCVICNDEVNVDHGSYSCSDCNIIFHVNCVTEYGYEIVSLENEGEKFSDLSIDSFTCVKRNDAGEATEIEHIKHKHNLMLSDKIMEYDKYCDGCLLPILVPFYYCSLCDFSLHKACAELPKKKHLWFHDCKQPLILQNYSDCVFECFSCYLDSNGFAYKCSECERQGCFRCVIALTTGALTCPMHDHPLFLYNDDYGGQCGACHDNLVVPFRCKVCNFALCYECFFLPIRARHKCDEHILTLTYHDYNAYSECHYCDICEEKRDPNNWFYRCATCDNYAHPHCVIGKYPFIKLGSMCQGIDDHPHSLIVVRKIYYYPKCIKCGKPCQDLAFECVTSGCNYIIHWKCRSTS